VILGGSTNSGSGYFTLTHGRNNTNSGYYSTIFGDNNSSNGLSYVTIVGCGITAVRECTLHANRLWLGNLPTSPTGLSSGEVYNNGGALYIV